MNEQVNSLEELIAAGTSELQMLADAGNTVAQQWLEIIQQQDSVMDKLKVFGEMRVTLHASLPMGDPEKEKEVNTVYDALWPKE